MRQHTQRHILKGRGGAPEQLQHMEISHGYCGGQILRLEFSRIGTENQLSHIGDIRQKGG